MHLRGWCRRQAGNFDNSGVGVDRLRRAFWNVTVGWRACNLLKMWWPETGLNRRRRPFQGRALPLSYLASVQTSWVRFCARNPASPEKMDESQETLRSKTTSDSIATPIPRAKPGWHAQGDPHECGDGRAGIRSGPTGRNDRRGRFPRIPVRRGGLYPGLFSLSPCREERRLH